MDEKYKTFQFIIYIYNVILKSKPRVWQSIYTTKY